MNNDLKEKRLAICEQCLLYKIANEDDDEKN